MSYNPPRRPSAARRAGSQVRFAEEATIYSPTQRQDLYNYAPNSPSRRDSHPTPAPTYDAQSHYEPPTDLSQYRIYDVNHSPRRGPDRFSAVPFSPGQPEARRRSNQPYSEERYHSDQPHSEERRHSNQHRSEERRRSDDTLTDIGDQRSSKDYGYPTKRPQSFDKSYDPQQSFDKLHDRPQLFNRSYSRNQNRNFSGPPGPARRDIEDGTDRRSGGFFNHVKDAFAQFTSDQELISRPNSRETSRRNSWADTDGHEHHHLNNFERTLRINAPDEETYLYDDEDRVPRHRLAPLTRAPSSPDDHWKSYHERRKREKHTIKHCHESMDEYHKFCLMFAKALLAFGSPSHRIEAQLNSLTKVFMMEAQFHHTTGTIQVSFGNPESRTAETCLIKSPVGLALGRIHAVHNVYRSVLHDDMYASHGTRELRKLLESPPRYGPKVHYILSFICCLLICGVAFGGSLNDMWVAGLMGLLVRVMQNIAAKSQLSASGSEVFTAALVSLIARAFSSLPSKIWCFTAISSAGVISLLPGYLILSGSLDIAGKNPALGSPKIVSGIMTSLYLGFGLTLGSDIFLFLDQPARRALAAATVIINPTVLTGSFEAFNTTSVADSFSGSFTFTNTTETVAADTVQGCFRNPGWAWYLQPLPYWSLFILVPLFAFCSSMNSQQHWWSRQMLVMVFIACMSFLLTRLANLHWGLEDHPDYVSLIGSWLVGILGNGYSRRFGGTAFTSMLTGILLLVPDGLSAAGGLAQNYQLKGDDEYTQSLTLARKMIAVIIGIMAGVYSSAAMIYFFGKRKNAALVTF